MESLSRQIENPKPQTPGTGFSIAVIEAKQAAAFRLPETGFKLSDAVADPMCAPFGWQTEAPEDMFRRGDPVGGSADLDRILALPRRPQLDLTSATAEAMVELEMAKYARTDNIGQCRCKEIDPRKGCITRLLPAQAWILREISMNQGLLAHASVGLGKTLLNILAPLALDNVKSVLLLIPASLVDQIQHDYQLIAQHFIVPGFMMHIGTQKPVYETKPIPGRPTLHVLPYSRLSMPEESDFLQRRQPDAIISDECDAIRSMTSSRGIRIAKWFAGGDTPEERQKRMSTKFLGWTGSLTDSSITEFNYLALFALRDKSPLPLNPNTVIEWGRCLDATTNPSPPGELLKFCSPGEDVRHAFRRRLAETPGFIIANVTDIEVTGGQGFVQNSISEKEAPELPPIVQEGLSMIRNDGKRPDSLILRVRPDIAALVGEDLIEDETLEDALAIAQAAQQVSVGVLYFHKYPRGEPRPLIKEWRKCKSNYFREVREETLKGNTFMDSAKLCEQAARRFWGDDPKRDDRPEWRCESWPAWRDIQDKVKPEMDSCVLDEFLCVDALDWAYERSGIVWYRMRALAVRMQELSVKAGRPLPIHDGGPKGGQRLMAERGDRSIICSIDSNGRGRDGLQTAFDRQLIMNMPASSSRTEQLLGRAHRRGQRSALVTTEIYLHTPELKKALKQAVRRSRYVRDILGADQKLLNGADVALLGPEDSDAESE